MQRTKIKIGDELAYVERPTRGWMNAVKVRVVALDGIRTGTRTSAWSSSAPAVRVVLVDPPAIPPTNDRGIYVWDDYEGGYPAYRAKCPSTFGPNDHPTAKLPAWTADVRAVHLVATWAEIEEWRAAETERQRIREEERAARRAAEEAADNARKAEALRRLEAQRRGEVGSLGLHTALANLIYEAQSWVGDADATDLRHSVHGVLYLARIVRDDLDEALTKFEASS